MMNPMNAVKYFAFIGGEIISGSWQVITRQFRTSPYATPMIVEVPMRCVTDLEVTLFASSITITPGTLVVASAAGTDSTPPTLFVQAVFETDEAECLAGLRDMESRLLRMTRGRAPGELGEKS